MEDDVIIYDDNNVPAIADDSLLRVAEMAERRIDAVIKIKQMALKVTNASDWTDQGGKPYLQVSGSEKVANLFNISWRLDEPVVETEADGHFTFTMRGIFSIPGRSISAEGSRSSKDPFFRKYEWVNGVKNEKPISAIDRRDVRMAALTNLLGNGISRLLGIRNLTYADLEAFAGIKRDQIGVVDYTRKDKDKAPINPPRKKVPEKEIQNPDDPATDNQIKAIQAILTALKVTDDLEKHQTVTAILELPETLTSFSKLTKGQASEAIKKLGEHADRQRQGEAT